MCWQTSISDASRTQAAHHSVDRSVRGRTGVGSCMFKSATRLAEVLQRSIVEYWLCGGVLKCGPFPKFVLKPTPKVSRSIVADPFHYVLFAESLRGIDCALGRRADTSWSRRARRDGSSWPRILLIDLPAVLTDTSARRQTLPSRHAHCSPCSPCAIGERRGG